MDAKTLKMTVQIRRDTNANWELHKDVIPAAGEPCFDLNLGTLKIGDGVKTYEQLDIVGGETGNANVIESISVGGTLLDIVEKSVDIPVAGTTLGVVKASDEVMIAADGSLRIGTISLSKLVQADGDTLVLDCGSATN